MNITQLARMHVNLSQSEFGEILGELVNGTIINQSRISQYESGAVNPSSAVREALSGFAARELLQQLRDQSPECWKTIIIDAIK